MKTYHATTPNDVTVVDHNAGGRLQRLTPDASQQIFCHSLDGFEWGYAGSGPAQLSLAILLDYYTDKIGAEQAKAKARAFYSAFKFAIIAKFPQGQPWQITSGQIARFLSELSEDGRSPRPRYVPLGETSITPGARDALNESGETAGPFLDRHTRCDWGDNLTDDDREENEFAYAHGMRLLSIYYTNRQQKIYVITEADRSHTTVLLPEDY